MIGAVSSYRDSKKQFYIDYYSDHKIAKKAIKEGVEAYQMQPEELMAETV
jgi:hypothetical protein